MKNNLGLNSKTLAFSANIAICNFFPALYEFERSDVYSPLSSLWVRQKQGVELPCPIDVA